MGADMVRKPANTSIKCVFHIQIFRYWTDRLRTDGFHIQIFIYSTDRLRTDAFSYSDIGQIDCGWMVFIFRYSYIRQIDFVYNTPQM